ncbi:UNKNOWN [Stylonychia lemnae]|uniref:HTH psq-type domain-containing protein n=1 Tax=Stylonychia lemnae TaxID=5949 RepID=A0A078B3G9_STYLE|nr:UNKNOWN [Stylonychia lemnae]|eukprot:CDW87777.1 UNKNOWN [Stylonychia lemnae]
MSKLSITAAAKAAGISRQTMYKKYINHGLISVETVNDIKQIDTSELLRVFGSLQPVDDDVLQPATEPSTAIDSAAMAAKDELIAILKQQIEDNKEREKWLMQQLEKTTHLLENKAEEKEKKRKKIFGLFQMRIPRSLSVVQYLLIQSNLHFNQINSTQFKKQTLKIASNITAILYRFLSYMFKFFLKN